MMMVRRTNLGELDSLVHISDEDAAYASVLYFHSDLSPILQPRPMHLGVDSHIAARDPP